MSTNFKLAAALVMAGLVVACLTFSAGSESAEHPNLVLTKAGVDSIRSELGSVPLFDTSLKSVRAEIDREIANGIETPVPEGLSGGYAHERHKKNFVVAQKSGALFQILQEEKYAIYVRDMLFQYEAMYKGLPVHPETRSYARGKLFWQCLNDSNWLVYMSQAYDAIYTWLSADERKKLEENLFRPFADYLSIGNPQFFNRVHNHSTWGNAAVGLIGLVMRDDELVQRALYGIPDVNLEAGEKDNDGGFIKVEGQKVGFLANLDEPFSPDGYYTEGPYYQRYAMYPFLVFAQGLHNVKPELKIFEHKNGVLLNAVKTLLNLSDANGEFFALNDGQKGMSIFGRELVTAVDIAFHVDGNDPRLLGIAQQQGKVLLDDAGLAVALSSRDGAALPFEKTSANYSDGSNGDEGGVAVLRGGDEELALVFKYSAQGLSHGHYDKLSFSLHEKGLEVLQDYGLARFVNIEQRGGGNYLPENKSWAKQSIAHNTVTLNQTSHFEGKYELGSKHHSVLHFFDASRKDIQVVSATETNAYPGTELRRTMAMITDGRFEAPIVLDVLRVASNGKNQYDLPFYFTGQIIKTNFDYEAPAVLKPLGSNHGYQHLYLEGAGKPTSSNAKLSWLVNGRFYTLTSVTDSADELLFTRIGANDPDFNLRRDPAFMIRRDNTKSTVFVNTLEPHGGYNPVSELAVNSNSQIAELTVVYDDDDYTAVSLQDVQGVVSLFVVANADAALETTHELTLDDHVVRWRGPYHYGAPK